MDRWDASTQVVWEVAQAFRRACDKESVPKRGRSSVRSEHWASVAQEYLRKYYPMFFTQDERARSAGESPLDSAARAVVAAFGHMGPDGRALAESAYRLGGLAAIEPLLLEAYPAVEDEDRGVIGRIEA